jgi:hypothetical protein
MCATEGENPKTRPFPGAGNGKGVVCYGQLDPCQDIPVGQATSLCACTQDN